jgi:hypothetical protein
MLPETLRCQRLGQFDKASRGTLWLDDPVVRDLVMGEEPDGAAYAGHAPGITCTDFAYEAGNIKVRFSQMEFDYIYITIHLIGHVVIQTHFGGDDETETPVRRQKKNVDFEVDIASLECPFYDFIRFLEGISLDIEECAFTWIAEFSYGRMQWERRFLKDTGFLTVEWSTSKEQFSHRMMLNTRQVVREFYSNFRRLIDSPDYDRLRYEGVTYGEALALVLSDASLDDLVEELVRRNAIEAKDLLLKLGEVHDSRSMAGLKNETRPIQYFLDATADKDALSDWPSYAAWIIIPEWENWDIGQRKAHLQKVLDYRMPVWEGNNLKKMRSKLIEDWLASSERAPRTPITAL